MDIPLKTKKKNRSIKTDQSI